MKTKLYFYSQPNYLTSRTAIEVLHAVRQSRTSSQILFALCLSKKQALSGGKSLACEDKCSKKIGAALVQQADRRSFEASAVLTLVYFYIIMIVNKCQQSAKRKLLLNSPTDRTFGNRLSRYKKLGKKVPQAYRVYVEDTFLPCDAGDARIFSKEMTHTENQGDNDEQKAKRYYYHSDHLGSAQFVTDWRGKQYEHIEYTPYGELWIEEVAAGLDKLPFRFTGKELDEETGLYYYGARYLDPKYSRWLSGDPALNEYIPKAPIDDDAKKHNENLPGMGGVFNTVNLHVYHYAGNNPIKYVDPDGRENKSSKDFIGYTMGYTVANIIKHAKISFSSNDRGYSLPWGSIGIPKNNFYQGGYNPDYYTTGQPTEIGRIGLEAHELWHQYQYATDPMAIDNLVIEQVEYSLGIKDPYIYGDSVKNPDILDNINKLSDIPTLEGQAQFVGQWNADVYAFISGDKVDMIRLRKEARIIFNSGFFSQAIFDILFINDERM